MTTHPRSSDTTSATADLEIATRERYAAAAKQIEPALCCAVDYDADVLAIIPREVIEKDYGCGDPTRHVRDGEIVLDLGSGAGKACFMAAQRVGADGHVIGVDFNDAMLEVARRHAPAVASAIGYRNASFHKGRIQDLALDLDRVDAWLRANPVTSSESLAAFEAECDRLRRAEPLVASDSVDIVVSNCVLNLVQPADKRRLFAELFRVLKRGGRAVISDIVCDESPSDAVRNDPALWSGCIAGAFLEREFLRMFEDAGFHGVEILEYQGEPWQTIDGVEYRSMTVRAFKGKQGACLERGQAVIYRGPWKSVTDDDGHTYHRGERMAVCDKTHTLLTAETSPYHADVVGLAPNDIVPRDAAPLWPAGRDAHRDPRETKSGIVSTPTTTASNGNGNGACNADGCC